MNNKILGDQGENLAAQYLISLGFEIVKSKFRNRLGEIDLIAKSGEFFYFIEVKTRTNERFGNIFETLPKNKIRKILMCALFFAKNNFIPEDRLKIGFIGIIIGKNGGISDIFFFDDISIN